MLPFYCETVILCYYSTVILCYHSTVVLCYYSTVVLCYCATVLVKDLVSIHDLCKSNHDYYPKWIKSSNIILSVIISYSLEHSISPFETASLTMLPFYCFTGLLCYHSNVVLWYCDTVLSFYWSTVLLFYCCTVLLCYCTSVRFSVYSWLVQVQPWLLSKMQKIQQYYFVCNNIIYFQTIQFFLLVLYHWL
jgi:hypothetical protein